MPKVALPAPRPFHPDGLTLGKLKILVAGDSGAGKSTLVRLINLLERPNEGSIAIGGQALTGLSEAQLRAQRRRIGMVFQGFNLLSRRTVYGNVALPLEIAGVAKSEIPARVERLLALVGLEHLRDRYPSQISGGQKQRVGIARALANNPDVLLSDEATSALDPETTHNILALLRDINRKTGVTVVMITHQMEVVREVCDRVAVLSQGEVVEMGSTREVFAQPRHEVTRAMVSAATASDLTDATLAAVKQRIETLAAAKPGQAVRLLQAHRWPCGGGPGRRGGLGALGRHVVSSTAGPFAGLLSILNAQPPRKRWRPRPDVL